MLIFACSYIHMDIAARNFLLGANNCVKVADFGLTQKLPESGVFEADPETKFPIKWCPPESLDSSQFSIASDVWAFGVFLWEIATFGMMPYPGIPNHQVSRYLKEGKRLNFKPEHPGVFKELCTECFQFKPADRTDFSVIASTLQEALDEMDTSDLRDIGSAVKSCADEEYVTFECSSTY